MTQTDFKFMLKAIRGDRSVKDFANELGISLARLYRYESGRFNKPLTEDMLKLFYTHKADSCKYTYDELASVNKNTFGVRKSMMKIKPLATDVIVPKKAHITDACFDIYAYLPDGDVVIKPGEYKTIRTGFTTEIKTGYFAAVFARSGLACKKHLRLSNDVGVIDADYRGEWLVALTNDAYEGDTSIKEEDYTIHNGDRIAQFTLLPVIDTVLEVVDELSDTERGTGGFGSSGK